MKCACNFRTLSGNAQRQLYPIVSKISFLKLKLRNRKCCKIPFPFPEPESRNLLIICKTRNRTLTDLTLSCPESLLKTTPPPPGYPWVSGGRYVTPKPRFRGLVLNHQLLKEPEPKKRSKRAKFDQKQQFLGGFLAPPPLNLDG